MIAAAVILAQGDGGDDAGPATTDRPPGLVMPNPTLTPGDVFPVTVTEVCVAGYSASVRDVSQKTKDQIYAAYGIAAHEPGQYEIDHLVPLAVGGSNDEKNLWPQPAEPRPGYKEKDRLEDTLHDLVCAGELDLATAQRAAASDWYAAYVTYVLGR